jgi:hypothetical protein
MTAPDYRAALAELIESVRYLSECWRDPENGVDPVCLAEAETQMHEASALLAAPEAVGQGVSASLPGMSDEWKDGYTTGWNEALTQHPAPVPVGVRLPDRTDCDSDGRCWWYLQRDVMDDPGMPTWTLGTYRIKQGTWKQTHWLPHWALPLPGAEP